MVNVAQWEFTNGDKKNYPYTIQKSYKDKTTGEYKNTNYFNESDIKTLIFGLMGLMTKKYNGVHKKKEEKKDNPSFPDFSNDQTTQEDEDLPF